MFVSLHAKQPIRFLFVILFCISVSVMSYGWEVQQKGTHSRKVTKEAGDLHSSSPSRRQTASGKMFHEIIGPLDSIRPKDRDYAQIVADLRDLCEKYPMSLSARMAVLTVRNWAEEGYLDEDHATGMLAIMDAVNPAKEELAKLEQLAAQAINANDADTLGVVAIKLNDIAQKHPDTLSEYLAIANLSPAYSRIGESKKSQEAAKLFLDKYPPNSDKSDYPSYRGYLFKNLFLYASGLSKTQSLDKSLEAYEMIANEYADSPMFAIPAIFDAAMLCFNNERYEDSIPLFESLYSNYSLDADNRVALAHFRVLDATLALGNEEKAEELARKLVVTFDGTTHWENQALRVRDWILYGRKQ